MAVEANNSAAIPQRKCGMGRCLGLSSPIMPCAPRSDHLPCQTSQAAAPTAIAWYMCLSEGLSFFRAQQSGGMFIEENRRVRVRAQDGRRRPRADFAFEERLYRLRFSCLGTDCKEFLRLQD